MRIGYLSMISDGDPFRWHQLTDLCRTMGLTIEYSKFGDLSDVEDAKRGWTTAAKLLREADAFIVDHFPLEHAPDLARSFHERIDAGARALVFPSTGDRDSLAWWSEFLGRYYVRPSWVKLVGPSGERTGLVFRRDEHCFRHPELFAGVDKLVADSPFALWYGGEAWAVLVGSSSHWGVETSTDLPDNWNGREMACMAVWHGHAGGAVLVASASSILSDPNTLPPGAPSGIENNKAFARNALRFLQHAKLTEGLSTTKKTEWLPTPDDLCKRIEINLADFVLDVLKTLQADPWVAGVPLPIRQEAAARQEGEGNRFPKEAYLDLIHLKTIMEKNWKLFEPYFAALGRHGGRDKCLAFMDRLNEIRRLIGHPLKMHVSGYEFSSAETDLLVEVDQLAQQLAACVRRRPSSP